MPRVDERGPDASAVEEPPRDGRDAPPAVSVLIATLNGARTLPNALGALDLQRDPPAFEVIVVDDGSEDSSTAIARSFGAQTITLERNQGHGHALNVGIRTARGDVIAMMDDDCVPPPSWLGDLATAWSSAEPSVTIIGGSVVPLETDTLNRRYVAFREPLVPQEAGLDEHVSLAGRMRFAFFPPPPRDERRPVYFVVGANMSIRRSAALEVGGFDETPSIAGEEEGIARKLRAVYGSETVQFVPSLVMRHDFAKSLRDTFRRSRTYGRAYGRRWADSGGIPTIRPVPIAALAIGAVGLLFSPVVGAAVLVASPFVLYRRWLRTRWKASAIERCTFTYLQLLEDLNGNVGFLEGWMERHRTHAKP
jgi:glycosyltransferase involved in cell wall biosynthesis